MSNFVMVRAYRGQPLRRVAIESGNGLIYLANPDRLDAVKNGLSDPVGFPAEDVFQFDEGLFGRLVDQWEADGSTEDALWRAAFLYQSSI